MELQFPRLEEGEGVDPAKGNKNTTNYRNFEAKADVIYRNEVRIYNMTVNPTQYITLQNRPPEIDLEEKPHGPPLNQWVAMYPCITLLELKTLFNSMCLGTVMTQKIPRR